MSKVFQEFRCGDCGGMVRMINASGERREFRRGVSLEIPRDLLIPKCEQCHTTYFGAADSARVDAALDGVFRAQQREQYAQYVGTLRTKYGVTQRDIERACAVTPTYFSHLLAGTKKASATLTRLIEAFIACPDELARHLGHPLPSVEIEVAKVPDGAAEIYFYAQVISKKSRIVGALSLPMTGAANDTGAAA
jgi:transcriptional regulator with XRE-family HTH domain